MFLYMETYRQKIQLQARLTTRILESIEKLMPLDHNIEDLLIS